MTVAASKRAARVSQATFRNRAAAPAATIATPMLTRVPAKSNHRPRQRICAAGRLAAGSTKWGRKGGKKKETLGLRKLTSIAARNNRAGTTGGALWPVAARARTSEKAIHSR